MLKIENVVVIDVTEQQEASVKAISSDIDDILSVVGS